MKKLYYLVLTGFVLATIRSNAQQDPQYTQYMYNMNVVNPAYAGSKDYLNIGALYRSQWNGIDGAPRTYTFNVHSPIGENTGLGLSAIKDKIGPINETNVYADFSYTLRFANSNLAFGIKAGATFHDVNLAQLALEDDTDAAFAENINNTYTNIGVGAFYYGDNYYIGLSVPNILNSTHLDADPDGMEYGNEEMHYFATAGYVFQIGENIKLKPSALVKSSFQSPLSFDVNLNTLFHEKFELGASYRYDDAVSGLVGLRISDRLQFGFAYDFSISDIDEPSYEGFIIFNVFFKKKTYLSPRYF